jgi:hypothetical protein
MDILRAPWNFARVYGSICILRPKQKFIKVVNPFRDIREISCLKHLLFWSDLFAIFGDEINKCAVAHLSTKLNIIVVWHTTSPECRTKP